MHMTTKEAAAAAHQVLGYLAKVRIDGGEAAEFRKEMRAIPPEFPDLANVIAWLRATDKNLSDLEQWDRENPEP
jgi:hypothetical protein